jgi:hypothetical protein
MTSIFRERGKRNEKGPLDTGGDCIVAPVKASSSSGRLAERVVHGLDDEGEAEQIVVWIERRPGAVWAVGRAVNPQLRDTDEPRHDDYIWEGYELDDALEAANDALEDDCTVSEGDGSTERVRPFRREELLEPLERFFFGR